ncbi:AIPR family protein [Streptomyces phaeochromogenes]|uniref:AIPR family protein n=1 Tax=Streptomyces phaeochromogenes TaxID=1923 RepID=A0ABZ1HE60_STRPH|nr:AIPR family protein [Streptomyces phaeochromogenes]WSD16889.1 AIPR family protein [Streptomyces phaeochromogenes]
MTKSSSQDLRRSCEQYAAKYGYSPANLEHGLEAYAAHVFAQENGFDALLEGELTAKADLSEYIFRKNDLGIDAFLEDPTNKKIILLQAAWRSKRLEEDKVASFFDSPSRITSVDYLTTGDDQVQELLADLRQKMADGYELQLKFVTNINVADKERLQELTEARNTTYEESDQAVVCELYGSAELMQRDRELQSAVRGGHVTSVEFSLQNGKFIELLEPYRTVIAVIKANELVDLYRRRDVGSKLFNLNIRLPLTSLKVNPKMVETAISDEEGPHFFYYNNGVAAVCSQYALVGNKLTAHRLQIINGAQTVSALAKARRRSPNSDVYVLFRLTETSEQYGGAFTENIIRYNNTQNPVKVSDFFSNDEIQIWIRDNLPKLSGKGPVPAFYYVHKSGYKPKGASGRGIKIEQLAGIRHAFLYGPVVSYREPAQFFDRSLRYWEAFGVDGKAVDNWRPEEVAQAVAAITIHQRIQGLGKELRGKEATRNLAEAKYLYRLARYVTGMVAVGLEAVRSDSFNDYQTLIASSPTFDKYVDPIIREARGVLRHEWRRIQENRAGVQVEYNLARDDKLWVRLSDTLKESVLTEVTF